MKLRIFLSVLLWTLLSGTVTYAAETSQMPLPNPDKFQYQTIHFAPPQAQRVVLDNGIILYIHEDHELPLVNIEAVVRCGSNNDPVGKEGIEQALALDCDYYYVCDVDNFTLPHTLSTLVGYNLPVVSPMLKMADPEQPAYSNYHLLTNVKGYYLDDTRYYQVLKQEVKGLIACDVVHCTYLIRKDILPQIKYLDGTDDYEYVIFSRELRRLNIPQYLDNTQTYGYLTTRERTKACVEKMADLRKEWVKRQLK